MFLCYKLEIEGIFENIKGVYFYKLVNLFSLVRLLFGFVSSFMNIFFLI